MSSMDRSATPPVAKTWRDFKGWIIGGIIVLIGFWMVGSYNGMATSRQAVLRAVGQTQNVLQRQNEVITAQVQAIESGGQFERGALTDIISARASANKMIDIKASDLAGNPELQKQLMDAIAAQRQAMLSLQAVYERYPNLKTPDLISKLQDEISGSANRVSVERGRIQTATEAYNNQIVGFPSGLVAKVTGFSEMDYYKAPAASQQMPNTRMNFDRR